MLLLNPAGRAASHWSWGWFESLLDIYNATTVWGQIKTGFKNRFLSIEKRARDPLSLELCQKWDVLLEKFKKIQTIILPLEWRTIDDKIKKKDKH